MQTNTETGAGPTSAERKLIGATERKGHVIKTWIADDYEAEVFRAGELVKTFVHENRGRAEREAEQWIDGQSAAALVTAVFFGWRLELHNDRSGTYRVKVSDDRAPDAPLPDDVPDFKGCLDRDQVMREATTWAEANPLRVTGEFGEYGLRFTVYRYWDDTMLQATGWSFEVALPDGDGGAFDSGMIHPTPAAATRAATTWCSQYKPGEPLPEDPPVEVGDADAEVDAADGEGAAAVETITSTPAATALAPAPEPTPEQPTPEQLAAEADAAIADTSAPATAVDGPLDDDLRDEVWTLLAQRKEVRARKTKVVQALNLAKAQLKAIDLELEELDQQIEEAYENAPRQRTLPLATAPRAAKPVAQGTVAKEAPKVVEQLLEWGDNPGEFVWPFNGVQHTIVCRALEPGKFRAAIKGPLESKTEGFGESAKEAISNCQDRASIFLADAEPGSITPTADTGPVADGAAPKRSRRKKLKGKSAKEVIAVLRDSMHVNEAAQTIGCTEAELEEFARENEIKLSDHLLADSAEEEKPVPKASKKKASKRGSKAGARGKRGGS